MRHYRQNVNTVVNALSSQIVCLDMQLVGNSDHWCHGNVYGVDGRYAKDQANEHDRRQSVRVEPHYTAVGFYNWTMSYVNMKHRL